MYLVLPFNIVFLHLHSHRQLEFYSGSPWQEERLRGLIPSFINDTHVYVLYVVFHSALPVTQQQSRECKQVVGGSLHMHYKTQDMALVCESILQFENLEMSRTIDLSLIGWLEVAAKHYKQVASLLWRLCWTLLISIQDSDNHIWFRDLELMRLRKIQETPLLVWETALLNDTRGTSRPLSSLWLCCMGPSRRKSWSYSKRRKCCGPETSRTVQNVLTTGSKFWDSNPAIRLSLARTSLPSCITKLVKPRLKSSIFQDLRVISMSLRLAN